MRGLSNKGSDLVILGSAPCFLEYPFVIHRGDDEVDYFFSGTIKRKKIALIVSLPENNWELARAAIESGVDAVKLHVNVEHRASGNHFYSTEAYRTEFHKIRSEFTGPLGIVPGGALESIQ